MHGPNWATDIPETDMLNMEEKATRAEYVTLFPFSLVSLCSRPPLRLDSLLSLASLLDRRCPLLLSSPSTPVTSVTFSLSR
jgi:hypothetical protein